MKTEEIKDEIIRQLEIIVAEYEGNENILVIHDAECYIEELKSQLSSRDRKKPKAFGTKY